MKPCPSRYNGAILKKFVVFVKSVQLFRHQLGCRKEEEGPCCLGSFAKAGWKLWRLGNGCGVGGKGFGYLTAIGHAKVTAVRLRTYYQLTRGRLKLFTFSRDAARKKNVLGAWEASLKPGRSCGVRERAPRKSHRRPPHKCHILMLIIVQFVNGLRLSTGFS